MTLEAPNPISVNADARGEQARTVAIIMDGNGRWAAKRNLPVAEGHREGTRALRRTVEAAIDLGVVPSNDGKIIRLPIPQLTEERRKELVKVVRHVAEEGRVAVRNVRRDTIHHLKELVDDGDVGADEEHRAEDRVQKLTDDHVHRIDELLRRKEAEIMEV